MSNKYIKIILTAIIGLSISIAHAANSSSQFPLTEIEFNQLFPNRNAVFTYDGLINAAAKFPNFLHQGTDQQKKSELIAFLANTSHETTGGWETAPGGTYAWGMYFASEVGCDSGECTQYSDPNSPYTPVAGQTYQGRGALQLSWNYNYGQASAAIFGDKEKLLQDPDLVATDPMLVWETAIWFWMTPQAPKPSAHAVMIDDPSQYGNDAFGQTVNIINGGIECGNGMNAQLKNRIGFYEHFATFLDEKDIPTNLGTYCADGPHFKAGHPSYSQPAV